MHVARQTPGKTRLCLRPYAELSSPPKLGFHPFDGGWGIMWKSQIDCWKRASGTYSTDYYAFFTVYVTVY